MKKQFKNNTSLLFKLIKNIVALMFIFCFFLFILYVLGNFKNFLDSTQILILRAITVCSIFLGVVAFLGFVLSFVFIFVDKLLNRKSGIIYVFVMLLAMIFSLALLVFSITVDYLAAGL